jgi:HEAT repeat protein
VTQVVEETAATSLELGDDTETAGTSSSTTIPAIRRLGLVAATAVLFTALSLGGSQFADLGSSVRRKEGDEFSDTATAVSETDAELVEEVRALFDEGATEFFQDGIQSQFSRSLVALLATKGNAALRAIAQYVSSDCANPDVVSEALRWLADYPDPAFANERWRLLLQTLRHPNPRVRDGAILGLSTLDSPHALPMLEEARSTETIRELRRLLDAVIEQLVQTAHAAAASNSQRK